MHGLRSEGCHKNLGPSEPTVLTQRETEVLRSVALGLGNREIGISLGISLRKVNAHMTNIFEKLEVNLRMDAVATLYSLAYWQEARGS
ncbi:MAG: helix-turn-helix transcriptional regulator [Dehalococcoidia bacterium]|nr:helix-turn-helix transcriptional regulator [Dehalococcoidia bacterium]